MVQLLRRVDTPRRLADARQQRTDDRHELAAALQQEAGRREREGARCGQDSGGRLRRARRLCPPLTATLPSEDDLMRLRTASARSTSGRAAFFMMAAAPSGRRAAATAFAYDLAVATHMRAARDIMG